MGHVCLNRGGRGGGLHQEKKASLCRTKMVVLVRIITLKIKYCGYVHVEKKCHARVPVSVHSYCGCTDTCRCQSRALPEGVVWDCAVTGSVSRLTWPPKCPWPWHDLPAYPYVPFTVQHNRYAVYIYTEGPLQNKRCIRLKYSLLRNKTYIWISPVKFMGFNCVQN